MSYEDDEINSPLLACPLSLSVFDRSSLYPHCLCQNYPNPEMEGTTLITIVKGDTLWDLATKHLEDPLKWPEFKQYNDFTNPDQIYPDEMMRIPPKW